MAQNCCKIAIANPETAVYGAAAKKILEAEGMWEIIKPRLVTVMDLAQVFQYASTGVVDAGFCNLFQAFSGDGKKGCYYVIKEAPAIIHSGCVLKRSGNSKVTFLFREFLTSSEVEQIRKKYGYR